MAAPAKKKFPGIFVVIAVTFVVYLSIVTWIIMVHYKKSPSATPPTASKVTVPKQ
jgi:hypothetical protein